MPASFQDSYNAVAESIGSWIAPDADWDGQVMVGTAVIVGVAALLLLSLVRR